MASAGAMTGTSGSVRPARVSRVCTGSAHLRRHALKGEEKDVLTLFWIVSTLGELFFSFLFCNSELVNRDRNKQLTCERRSCRYLLKCQWEWRTFQGLSEVEKKQSKKSNLVFVQQRDSLCLQMLCFSLCVPLAGWKPAPSLGMFSTSNLRDGSDIQKKKRKERESI